MKSVALALAASSVVLAASSKRQTLPSIEVKGNAFYAGDKRFYIRGIDYQPGGSSANFDPLADSKVCKRDLEFFKEMGINTIRVYATDNSKSHKECMDAYAAAGIYLILDANNPQYSIHRYDPHPSYNSVYLQSVFATIDEFAKYPNTMAFFSGNEVMNENLTSVVSAPYVKAVTRDMRGYIKARGYRQIPVGYSAADVAENRMQTAKYFNCGTDDERSDFFGFNDYSWCSSDFKTAGWDVKVKNFTDYGLPIFLSEYGCNTNVRDFGEHKALMSSDMTAVYSGGLMYEYTYEENKYGIVKLNGGVSGTVEKLQPEYNNFIKALKDSPAPSGSGGAATATHSVPCPAKDPFWNFEGTLLPAIPEGAKKFFQTGAGAGPGLNGPGSQTAGDRSPGNAQPGSGAVAGPNGAPAGGKPNAASGLMSQASFVLSGVAVLATLVSAIAL